MKCIYEILDTNYAEKARDYKRLINLSLTDDTDVILKKFLESNAFKYSNKDNIKIKIIERLQEYIDDNSIIIRKKFWIDNRINKFGTNCFMVNISSINQPDKNTVQVNIQSDEKVETNKSVEQAQQTENINVNGSTNIADNANNVIDNQSSDKQVISTNSAKNIESIDNLAESIIISNENDQTGVDTANNNDQDNQVIRNNGIENLIITETTSEIVTDNLSSTTDGNNEMILTNSLQNHNENSIEKNIDTFDDIDSNEIKSESNIAKINVEQTISDEHENSNEILSDDKLNKLSDENKTSENTNDMHEEVSDTTVIRNIRYKSYEFDTINDLYEIVMQDSDISIDTLSKAINGKLKKSEKRRYNSVLSKIEIRNQNNNKYISIMYIIKKKTLLRCCMPSKVFFFNNRKTVRCHYYSEVNN